MWTESLCVHLYLTWHCKSTILQFKKMGNFLSWEKWPSMCEEPWISKQLVVNLNHTWCICPETWLWQFCVLAGNEVLMRRSAGGRGRGKEAGRRGGESGTSPLPSLPIQTPSPPPHPECRHPPPPGPCWSRQFPTLTSEDPRLFWAKSMVQRHPNTGIPVLLTLTTKCFIRCTFWRVLGWNPAPVSRVQCP